MSTIFISDGNGPDAAALAAHLTAQGYAVYVNHADLAGCTRVDVDTLDRDALGSLLSGIEHLAGVVHFTPAPKPVSIQDAGDDQISDAFRTGSLCAMTLVQAAGERLGKAGEGAIVLVGDVHAEKPTGSAPLHAIQSAAIQMLCREAAMDLGRQGVSVFYVMRGGSSADEPLESPVSNQWAGPHYRHPDGALPDPGYLNGLLSFLLTSDARPLNGSDIRADGGYVLYYGLPRPGEVKR